MSARDYQFVVLNSAQLSQPGNTPFSFANSLAQAVGFTENNAQVCLYSMSYELKPNARMTYLVFNDTVVPEQMISGEQTSLLRLVHCPVQNPQNGGTGVYEPANLAWVSCTGVGSSLNFINTLICDTQPDVNGVFQPTSDLTGTTLITLAFRSLESAPAQPLQPARNANLPW